MAGYYGGFRQWLEEICFKLNGPETFLQVH